jgi:hypothetical protein
MPIVTRTVALGIPPRVHEPNPKPKAKASRNRKKSKRVSKQVASESESESEESEPTTKKNKRRRVDSDNAEVIDEDVEVPEEIEEADAQVAKGYSDNDPEVSQNCLSYQTELTRF